MVGGWEGGGDEWAEDVMGGNSHAGRVSAGWGGGWLGVLVLRGRLGAAPRVLSETNQRGYARVTHKGPGCAEASQHLLSFAAYALGHVRQVHLICCHERTLLHPLCYGLGCIVVQ